jgi:hypothetical protein
MPSSRKKQVHQVPRLLVIHILPAPKPPCRLWLGAAAPVGRSAANQQCRGTPTPSSSPYLYTSLALSTSSVSSSSNSAYLVQQQHTQVKGTRHRQ